MSVERKENKFAGVLIKAIDTNRVLLTLRSDKCSDPHTWALISGGINYDEDVLIGLKREVYEELGIHPDVITYEFKHTELAHNMEFLYYEGFTEHEFIPILNEESDAFGWFEEDELPNPLYDKIGDKIKNICKRKNKK